MSYILSPKLFNFYIDGAKLGKIFKEIFAGVKTKTIIGRLRLG